MSVSIVDRLKRLDDASLEAALAGCCASPRWVREMMRERPFADDEQLLAKAAEIWTGLARQDWLAAFAAHPQIGDIKTLQEKFAGTHTWASAEQAGVAGAGPEVLQRLLVLNREYLERFGYIFIVCATGKTAQGMLTILEHRLPNEPAAELSIAAAEQLKITLLRLRKLAP